MDLAKFRHEYSHSVVEQTHRLGFAKLWCDLLVTWVRFFQIQYLWGEHAQILMESAEIWREHSQCIAKQIRQFEIGKESAVLLPI